MEKLPGKTMDLVQHNIDNLKQLFPEVVTEGKIDFEKLKLVLGGNVEIHNEKYEFTWNGKSDAIKLAQTPSLGTLRPDKESSKNWDETENLYIEGDNLEVLKLLQKSYFGKVKMIYIDPPYNTGKDFVYKDNFRDNIKNYKEQTEQTTKANTETNGRYHTDWLNMMYPRLKLARNLLKEDGIIFISIDDNEQTNLKKICDEIFGEDNFITQFIWKSKLGKVGTTNHVANVHEYIIMYSKNKLLTSLKQIEKISEGRKENLRQWGQNDRREDRPSMFYPILLDGIEVLPIKPDGTEGRWRVGKEKAEELIREGALELADKDGKYEIYRKFIPGMSITPHASIIPDEVGTTANGSRILSELNLNKVFDYSKSVNLLIFLADLLKDKDGIILDFFSGSSTTAHAIMQLNAQDGGSRRFIMVQLPEKTDEKSEAYKSKYEDICKIGQERIRRAGDKIVSELGNGGLDIGFKLFKLENSNLKQWNSEETLEDLLSGLESNVVSGRTTEDLLYEILLKIGLPLTAPIEIIDINGKTVYDVAFGSVLLCLDDDITLDVVGEMLNYVSEDIETKIVFKEIGFRDDTVKTNAIQTLKKHGVKEDNIRSV
ncbi:site-specific DNA-methyltransferase [Bacillus anthracis]|uniref:site-specific DNA-methyltransferase n=1 Tax=Bacillus cereus group TaxID=86661 RepID=UPI000976616A|nr:MULTISPECIES: site-specific DNA-methyltransferase [Bacillus cereus group]MEB9506506.1 site-specific DNA-methyltransferase [Bacillus anthracis]ONH02195.1 site-specific DNA-methyltransferase [Bacillus cereus]